MVHTNNLFCLEGEREGREYLSSDSVDGSEFTNFDAFEHLSPKFLNCLKTYALSNYSIKLKIGTTIMLL